MSARPEITALANALRRHTSREVERRRSRQVEAVVVAVSPLRLDVLGHDDDLDEDDVTIGNVLAAHLADNPLAVDDVLVLVESDDGEYLAVDVLAD